MLHTKNGYNRRCCFKELVYAILEANLFSGIKEEEREDKNKSNIINKEILKDTGQSIELSRIGRCHRVGPIIQGKSRDIVVRFLSYRDRALVYIKQKNLKTPETETECS